MMRFEGHRYLVFTPELQFVISSIKGNIQEDVRLAEDTCEATLEIHKVGKEMWIC